MRFSSKWLSAATALLLAVASSCFGADRYRIDSANSSMGFSVHQFLNVTHGSFKDFSGTIVVDPEHPEQSSATARIQLKSIDTGIRKRDEHLLSPEFFDAGRYPEAVFRSRKVIRTGPERGDIVGDLTMHGVTRPTTLHVQLLKGSPNETAGQTSRWSVSSEPLRRRDFNLMFSTAAETVSGIGQEVALKFEILATKAD